MFQFNCQAVILYNLFCFSGELPVVNSLLRTTFDWTILYKFSLLLFFQSMIPPRIEQQSASSPCDLFGPPLLSGAQPLRDHLHEFLIDAFRSDLTYFWLE